MTGYKDTFLQHTYRYTFSLKIRTLTLSQASHTRTCSHLPLGKSVTWWKQENVHKRERERGAFEALLKAWPTYGVQRAFALSLAPYYFTLTTLIAQCPCVQIFPARALAAAAAIVVAGLKHVCIGSFQPVRPVHGTFSNVGFIFWQRWKKFWAVPPSFQKIC